MILCLALAYYFGAQSATAQAPSNPIVAMEAGGGPNPDHFVALTANGDMYGYTAPGWVYRANVFTGPTPATQPTWGGVKARYRPGASTAPQDK